MLKAKNKYNKRALKIAFTHNKWAPLFVCLLAVAFLLPMKLDAQTYNSTNTGWITSGSSWNLPTGLYQITKIEAIGGGGGGGHANTHLTGGVATGGGGGGGYAGYSHTWNRSDNPSVTYSVGGGGKQNEDGGNTIVSVNGGSTITAKGGKGVAEDVASGGSGGGHNGPTGYVGHNGGNGGKGKFWDMNYSAAGGGGGGAGANGIGSNGGDGKVEYKVFYCNVAKGTGGAGGNGGGGAGGDGQYEDNTVCVGARNGNNYGGGGGGARAAQTTPYNAGSGATGAVRIFYTTLHLTVSLVAVTTGTTAVTNMPAQTTIPYYEDYSTISALVPTQSGYTFIGWYFDQACTQPCTSGICSRTSNFTLYGKFLQNLTPGAITSGSSTICKGSTASNIANVTSASSEFGTVSYQWQVSTNGGSYSNISGATNASYTPATTYTNAGGTYKFRRMASDGSSSAYSNEYTLTVNAPAVTLNEISASATTVCSGSSVTLTASTSSNTGTVTYKWSANNSTDNPLTVNPTAQTTYTVTATATVGSCTATDTKSKTINIYPTFSAGAISSTGETICKNGTPSAIGSTTAATGGDGSITYKWQVSTNGGSYTDIASSNSATFTPSAYMSTGGTYTFKRLAKDGACHTDWAASSNLYTLTVKAPAVTLNDISSSASTVCKGSDVTLTASTSSSTGTVTYKWSANNSTANPLTVNPTVQTTYTVTATATDGSCTVTDTKSKTINVYPDFSAGAIASTGEEISVGETASEIGSTIAATGGNGSISYQWFAGESQIEGATSASYTPGETYTGVPGTYTFTRKAKDGACVDWTLSENSYVLTVVIPIYEAITDRGNIADCETVESNESFTDSKGQKVNRPAMSQYGELLNSSECPSILAVITENVMSITNNSSVLNGKVAGSMADQVGFVYGYHKDMLNLMVDVDEDVVGEFEYTLSSISPNTDYYVSAFAVFGTETLYGDTIKFTTLTKPCLGTPNADYGENGKVDSIASVTYQGYTYKVIEIGSQCWLAENLRAQYSPSTGRKITLSQGQSFVGSGSSKCAAFYDGDSTNYSQYGIIYNWCAAMDTFNVEGGQPELSTDEGATDVGWHPTIVPQRRGICPKGWHIPSDGEFHILENFVLDGITASDSARMNFQPAGTGAGRLATGYDWVASGNASQSGNYSYVERNRSGFGALPAGGYSDSRFDLIGHFAVFMSATQNDNNSFVRALQNTDEGSIRLVIDQSNAFSVRCLRDVYTSPALSTIATSTPAVTSISVAGSLTSLGGAASANVKVCAYTNANYSGTPICSDNQLLNAPGNFNITIQELMPGTNYYLAVISDNGWNKDTVKLNETTLTPTLTISSNPSSATVKMCGASSVSVTYKANLTGATATGYVWNTSGGSATASTTGTYTVNYTTTGTYTVTCTAAGLTATKQVTIASGGTIPELGLCEDCDAGKVVVKVKTNVASIEWRNTLNEIVSSSTTSLIQSDTIPAGIYTATAKSSSGCTVTRTATLGNAVVHPCSVTSLREGTALDGGKYANKEYGEGTRLDSVSDHEGNVYRVVEIGNGTNVQCWLAENMRAETSPSSGKKIVKNISTYSNVSKLAGYYSNSKSSYGKYGVLYNWCAAVDTFDYAGGKPEVASSSGGTWSTSVTFEGNRRGICPQGWHVPTLSEFQLLASNAGAPLGGANGVIKLIGGCDWKKYSGDNTNKAYDYANPERNLSGFSALPAGEYSLNGFYDGGADAYFHVINPNWSGSSTYIMEIYYGSTYLRQNSAGNKYDCCSVRCLRD